MKELERLRESIRTLLKDIQFNNESGLDNTFNYELYEELSKYFMTTYDESGNIGKQLFKIFSCSYLSIVPFIPIASK